jgi:hypothetical protein
MYLIFKAVKHGCSLMQVCLDSFIPSNNAVNKTVVNSQPI